MSKNLQKSFTFLLVICLVLSSSINIVAADDQGASNAPLSTSTIYSTDFEADNGGFTTGGSNNSWEWGELTSSSYGPGTGNAASGVKVWGTDLDYKYYNSANCYIESPEIDLTIVSDAQLTFNHWYALERNYDYGYVKISTDNGANWTELAEYNEYKESWDQVSISLNEYVGNTVKVRFILTSDGSANKEGWYIDDVAVSGTLAGPVPPTITTPTNESYTNQDTVTVTGTVENDGIINVYVNEVFAATVNSLNNEFSADITLNEGQNIITATTIVETEETRHSDSVTIVKDTVLPVLTITSPPDGHETVGTVEVTGAVTEDNLDNVTVNDSAVEVGEDGSFTGEVLIDQDVNIITVIATDLAGNSVTEQITVNKANYEQPAITHEPITSTFAGVDLKVEAFVINDEEVTDVEILVKNDNMIDWISIPMTLSSGSNLKGTYQGTISKDYVIYPGFEYQIEATDISLNLGQTDIYNVVGTFGIVPGEYTTDFTDYPEGWTLDGDWEWGHPTAGTVLPEGDYAIGTNLDGSYSSATVSRLIMPPIDLRNAEEASLWFDRWYELYGNDIITIEISIDNGQTWGEPLVEFKGEDESWKQMAIDLNPYVGSENQVWVAFKLATDYSYNYDGMFIDNVELKGVDTESPAPPTELGVEVNNAGIVTLSWTGTNDLDLKGYNVYRSTVSGEGYELIVSTETTSYVDSDAIGGSTYFYIVKAYDFSQNESEATNEVSADVPLVSTFYFSDFEADDGQIITGIIDGVNNSWEWGIPNSTYYGPGNAASGEKVWATKLTDRYDNDGEYYIETPEIDLTNALSAYLEFNHFFESEDTYDKGYIKISTDDGVTWTELTRYVGYAASSWTPVEILLDEYIGQPVKIRFILDADYSTNRDGWYIDDIIVYGEVEEQEQVSYAAPTIVTPLDGEFTNQETIQVTGTVETDGAVNVYVNGELAVNVNSVNNEFSAEGTLTEGENIITATLVVNNVETEQSTPVTVIKDTVLPVIEITSPQDGLTTYAEVVEVSGTVTDVNLENITVNGNPVQYAEDGSFTIEVTLQEGENIITVAAIDLGTNTVTEEITVYKLVLAAPTIVTPLEGEFTNQETVEVTGTVETDGAVNVYVNGELETTVNSVNNEFSAEVTLTEGENIITAVLVVETVESEISNSVTIIKDATLPTLEISLPQDGLTTNNQIVEVSGIATDDYLTSVTVNGEGVEFAEDGSFSTRVIVEEGENTIIIAASDFVGNAVTEERTIIVNLSAPTITDIQPATDQVVEAGDEIEVSFNSNAIGGTAYFRLLVNAPTSNNGILMEEVEPGYYVGTWIVPENMVLQNAVIEIELYDIAGNRATAVAEGKLSTVEKQQPPVLIPDTTDNRVGEDVDITFTDDLTWRGLITDITVDGESIIGQYSISEGNINIDSSVFTEAKSYEIVVKADGYEDSVVNQEIEEEEVLVPGIEIINGEYVSSDRPVIIKGIANEEVDWEVNIIDPNGTLIETLTATGITFEGSWGPNEFKKLNGQYTVEVNEIVNGAIILTEEFTINVYNYPIKINSIEILEQNGYVAIEAAIENLGPNTQSPMLVIQVRDEQNRVVSITTAKMEGLLQGYIVKLSSGFKAPGAGTYNVDIFVWTGWDNTEALSSPETATFTIE